jgi:predicted ATP-dependent protease
VGGIKEKLLAARAAGLTRALVPVRNMRDVELEAGEATRAPQAAVGGAAGGPAAAAAAEGSSVLPGLVVVPVATLEEVLAAAFDPPLVLRHKSKL